MRIRRNYWFVPALAILGLLFAVMHFYTKSKVKVSETTLVFDPKEPPPPLPSPDAKPVTPAPTPAANPLPQAANPAPVVAPAPAAPIAAAPVGQPAAQPVTPAPTPAPAAPAKP